MDFEWYKDGFCWMKQNSKWKAKSKVVLDYELKHMDKELDE
jgi:hypothetical protein